MKTELDPFEEMDSMEALIWQDKYVLIHFWIAPFIFPCFIKNSKKIKFILRLHKLAMKRMTGNFGP